MNFTSELVAVVIPLYKTKLTALENAAMEQCFKILHKYPIIAVKPDSLSLAEYNFNFDEVVCFEDHFFENITGYNQLMLSPSFYQKFLKYTYILIYQTDAFVFKDDLSYWCNQNYDYIGAPWLRYAEYPDALKKFKNLSKRFVHTKLNVSQRGTTVPTTIQIENRVGNGGLSLRNTAALNNICQASSDMINYYNSRREHQYNEDIFFGLEVNRWKHKLNIPDYRDAIFFSMETELEHAFRLTKGILPFGCHAWNLNLGFWAPIILEVAGIDIMNLNALS